MPGFSTRDQIISAISVGGRQDMWNFHKVSTGANMLYWFSTQAIGGTPGTTTLAASATSAPTNTAASVIPGTMFFSNVSPTYSRHLLSAGILGATATGTAMIYDRLFVSQNISLASAVSVTIPNNATVPITRYTGASTSATAGLNEIWIELSVATGATAGAFTVTYVDGAGVSQTTPSQSPPTTSMPPNSMFRVQLLATASPGVRSVTSVNISTGMGSTSANILIVRPLTYINFGSGLWNEVSFLDDVMGLPRIYDGAALCIATITPVTTQIWGNINTVYN